MNENTIAIWSMIGTWVASIGTISAVITSLWLARAQGKIKLDVLAGHRNLVEKGAKSHPDYCFIKVVNQSVRPAKITCIGWEFGSFRNKKHLIQFFGFPESDSIPKMLDEGQEAIFLIPFDTEVKGEAWIKSFPKQLTKEGIKNLKVCIYTSVGQAFKVKIEKGLKEQLLSSITSENQS